MKAREHLETIFRADRTADDAEARLLEIDDRAVLVEVLAEAAGAALDSTDRRGATRQLERLADLCAQVPGPMPVDTLIAILNDGDPAVRVAAGEALLDVGYDRYAEVARGVERAAESGLRGPAMHELPWLIAELAEPSAVGLVRRFLTHPEVEVVAAGVEALVALGDAGAIADLEPLESDTRSVTLDDFEQETTSTLGELASEAIAELRQQQSG